MPYTNFLSRGYEILARPEQKEPTRDGSFALILVLVGSGLSGVADAACQERTLLE
jgi:hypothetical protein